jgi:hypothetical protein
MHIALSKLSRSSFVIGLTRSASSQSDESRRWRSKHFEYRERLELSLTGETVAVGARVLTSLKLLDFEPFRPIVDDCETIEIHGKGNHQRSK